MYGPHSLGPSHRGNKRELGRILSKLFKINKPFFYNSFAYRTWQQQSLPRRCCQPNKWWRMRLEKRWVTFTDHLLTKTWITNILKSCFIISSGLHPSESCWDRGTTELSPPRLSPWRRGESGKGSGQSNFPHSSQGRFQRKLVERCCEFPFKIFLLVKLRVSF